ncbi:unnamed protein product [Durusdinium trenchii]|uniref:J domain-containing protein n=1 Tax=Durusdinium trenchii TaxID=1381693 RepID=A0ABP0JXS9_9DINO
MLRLVTFLGIWSWAAAGFCAFTSDESTQTWPAGWREGLRALHDLFGCEGYNRGARPSPGTVAELLAALDMEDDGTEGSIDLQRLKRSYRDLSVKHHPDKSSDSGRRFQQLRDAFEILEDPVKLLLYDTGGLELLRRYEAHAEEVPQTENLEISHQISLEDAYAGGSYKLEYSRHVVCLSCRLQPRLPRCRRCQACPDEIEHRQVWVNSFEYYVKELRKPSPERCRRGTEFLPFAVERGSSSGDRLRFEGRADQLPSHVPGDVLVTLQIKPHHVFKKVGADLVIHLRISLMEALLGFQREIHHLDGHLVQVSLPRGSVLQPEELLVVEGEGMPLHDDPSSYGRLLVRFTIDFPETLAGDGRGLCAKLRSERFGGGFEDGWLREWLEVQGEDDMDPCVHPRVICDHGHVVLLNGSALGWRTLPESIGHLQGLRQLFLRNNHLSSLPESFGNLTELVFLYLENNHLSSLPHSLGQLKSLWHLYLQNNQLTSLPESLGNLQSLLVLYLEKNQLTSLPESLGNLTNLLQLFLRRNRLSGLPGTLGNLRRLQCLHVHENRLRSLPSSLGNLQGLESLFLQENQLTSLPDSLIKLTQLKRLHAQHNDLRSFPNTSGTLLPWQVALLQHNRMSSLEALCDLPYLTTLYLHHNQLRNEIPTCIGSLDDLQVLTLHRNALTGPIPPRLAQLPRLKVLTLHGNRLMGSLPATFHTSAQLLFFSAFSNDFTGQVPPMKLQAGCIDDESFWMDAPVKGTSTSYTVTCDVLGRLLSIESLELTKRQYQEILDACPQVHRRCKDAPSRGPTLLLQSNRLSCTLPLQVAADNSSDLRSLMVVGNMLGTEWMDLPRWVSKSERQPFLYVSPLKFLGRPISGLQGLFLILIGLLTLFLACLRFSLSCFNCKELMETMREHREDHLWRSHLFLIRQILVLLPMATLLFWCYTWHASYYECGRELSKTTLAYFEGGQMAELALACLWSSWSLLCLYHARRIPKPGRHLTSSSSSPLAPSRVCGRCRRNLLLKSAWCALWFMLVVILSLPSLGYAFVQSLPRENSFQMQSTSVLKAVHGGAALLMLLIDARIQLDDQSSYLDQPPCSAGF